MNPKHPAKLILSISAFLALSVGTAIGTVAKTPAQSDEMEMLGNSVSTSYSALTRMSDAEFEKLMDVRNAKGEKLFFNTDGGNQPNLWATLDAAKDRAQGTSTEKSYATFKLTNTKEVVVAVIDSGVDIHHEDLQGKIWVNTKEVPGNGVDDDNNGYIDDVNGWNFLGNAKGENIDGQTLEVTREYARLTKKQEAGTLTASEAELLKVVKKTYEEKLAMTQLILDRYLAYDAGIKLLKANGLKEETIEGLAAVTSTDPAVIKAKELVLRLYAAKKDSAYVAGVIEAEKVALEYQFNTKFDSSTIVGDHPEILDEKGYGNNDVIGPDASHGTHVSGIIAADRMNNLGILGQSTNVKIMVIRAVPNGDERDKDVGNAIRYAVDQGAKIINMSFGKEFSPQKAYVDAAMKYAEEHNVLLVHAAGNDSKNTESFTNNYPNAKLMNPTRRSKEINSWIEVGASAVNNADGRLAAEFTNFGRTSVDLFAPGVDIVSTIPGSKYASFQGTSMASPEVAGVAALVLSAHPNLDANALKNVLMSTVQRQPRVEVVLPSDEEGQLKVPFSALSRSGGIVNAFNALKMLRTPQQ